MINESGDRYMYTALEKDRYGKIHLLFPRRLLHARIITNEESDTWKLDGLLRLASWYLSTFVL